MEFWTRATTKYSNMTGFYPPGVFDTHHSTSGCAAAAAAEGTAATEEESSQSIRLTPEEDEASCPLKRE